MYREVEWAVPADPYILSELAAYEGWHTPKNLELNTEFSRQWIAQRCRVYVEQGLTERHEEDPAYRLTIDGRDIVSEELESGGPINPPE
ncbi:hypothetical protein [Halostella litorea]|uniref:hypothetical protein n=1 Tax=Halostella litorea TaxID=2528831 RepID=UPI001092525F|nr:hypothetical protein [Halostella litorea]